MSQYTSALVNLAKVSHSEDRVEKLRKLANKVETKKVKKAKIKQAAKQKVLSALPSSGVLNDRRRCPAAMVSKSNDAQ